MKRIRELKSQKIEYNYIKNIKLFIYIFKNNVNFFFFKKKKGSSQALSLSFSQT